MSEIGIISNPHAKINRNDPEHNTLVWYVLGSRGRFEVTNSLKDLESVCQSFAKHRIETVGIIGGDGTISLTLEALLQSYGEKHLPQIMLLRGGTVNVLAGNFGIFGQPKDILSDFMDFYHSSRPLYKMHMRSLRVNGQLGFLFGTGCSVRFLEEFYKNKTSAAGAGRFFSSLLLDALCGGRISGKSEAMMRPEPCKIVSYLHSVDNRAEPECQRAIETEMPICLASTAPKIPYGIELFPSLKRAGDRAQLVYADLNSRELPIAITKALVLREKKNSGLHWLDFHEVDLLLPAGSRYTLDGEIVETESGEIKIGLGPIFEFLSPYGRVLDNELKAYAET